MKRIFLPILFFGMLATACSGSSDSRAEQAAADTSAVYTPADQEAYNLGASRASQMLARCGSDTTAIQDALLEIHAEASAIADQRSRRASIDYRRGFIDQLREEDPLLSATLF